MYTKEAIELVERYYQTWPRVFEFLSNSNLHNNDAIFETTLFPGEAAGKLAELARWLKEQPHSSAERQSCGVKTLETDTLKSIIGAVSALKVSTIVWISKIIYVLSIVFFHAEIAEKKIDTASETASFVYAGHE